MVRDTGAWPAVAEWPDGAPLVAVVPPICGVTIAGWPACRAGADFGLWRLYAIGSRLLCVPGVSPDASGDEVRRAYREAALRLHPDRNGGSQAAGERMREINEAWQVLRDPDRRSDYDRCYWSSYGLRHRVDASAGSGTARVWVSPMVFVSARWTEP